jgi:hypothetical protein
MFALITPAEIDDSWVSIVVPHELTHLVFDTATKNPYHEPPHWLNEGLAVYLSQGYDSSDRNLVEDAAKSDTIMPLDGLVGAFPTTRDRFFLAYAESVSAVDWIVANKSRDALIALIRSYANGVSDDEAFSTALGLDTAAFQQAWLDSVGATAPVRHGPVPAPVGPLPEGWSGAAPNATIQPGASAVAATPMTNSPGGLPAGSGGLSLGLVAAIAVIAVIVVLAALTLVRRSHRRPVGIPPGLRAEYPDPFATTPPPTADREAPASADAPAPETTPGPFHLPDDPTPPAPPPASPSPPQP